MIAARRKIHLADRQRYERYVRALGPVCWLPMRERSGTVAVNRAYQGGETVVLDETFQDWTGTPPSDYPVGWTASGTRDASHFISEDPDGFHIFTADTDLVQITRAPGILVGDTHRYALTLTALNSFGVQYGNFSAGLLATADQVGIHAHRRVAASASVGLLRYGMTDAKGSRFTVTKVGELDGAIGGTTALAQTGPTESGEALLFDGATSLITVYNRASIQGLTALTLWTLFNPASAGEGNAGTLFSKAGEFELRFNSASRDLVATVNYSGTNAQRITNTTLSANGWHTVGMRIDDSSKLPDIVVDGVEASYASSTTGVGTRASTTNNLIIGNNAAVSQTFAGLLDEALLTDQSLTASELRLLHLLAGLD